MKIKSIATYFVLLVGLLIVTHSEARADSITFNVNVNTSSLIGNATGPFSLNFQMTNGNSASNSITISNFSFDSGAPAGGISYIGGASGDLSGTVSLNDTEFLNDFAQEFTPGSMLSFTLTLTTNYAGGTPDLFTFAILDANGFEIATFGLGDVLFSVEISSTMPRVLTFTTDPSRTAINIPAPGVNAVPAAAVPEPATIILLGMGLAGIAVRKRRKAQ